MARPTDWTPLGYATDPVPGDPAAVSRQAAHLSSVSRQITDQVGALRKIAAGGADGALVGQYVDKIRSSAGELAGQLEKAEGRYREVASALRGWAPDLEQAQAQSVTALNDAAVPYQKLLPQAPLPSGSNLTAQQKQEVTDYHNSMNRAQSELNDAKALLARAVAFRDQQAGHCAAAINKAIDDGVKDSWWESHVEEFIHQYAWLLTDVATGLEFLATAIAIAAIFCSGIGILLIAGLVVGALLLRTVLALNHDGSWKQVILDAVSMASLGLGAGITYILGRYAQGTQETAAGFLQGERTLQALSGASKLSDDPIAGRLLSEDPAEAVLSKDLEQFEENTPGQRFFGGGDQKTLADFAKVTRLTNLFSDSPVMRGIASDVNVVQTFNRVNYLGALVPDWGDKLGDGISVEGPEGPVLDFSPYRSMLAEYDKWKSAGNKW
jgi:hypothetical protein